MTENGRSPDKAARVEPVVTTGTSGVGSTLTGGRGLDFDSSLGLRILLMIAAVCIGVLLSR